MLPVLHFQVWVLVEAGVTAFAIAVLTMPLAIFLLNSLGAVDHVSANKIHRQPVPRGGGIVIFFAFAVAVLAPNYRENPMNGVLIGAFICLVVGAADDFTGGIPAVWKFLTLLLVTGVLYYYGVRLKLFPWEIVNFAFTLLWIVGVTSAFNGIDNMDGLAGGVSVIAAAMYLIIAIEAYLKAGTETSLSWFGLLAAGLIGANLGFLVYNFRPARVFMGDAGSFFLGFTLAALGVMGEWTESPVVSATVPVLILGVPIFDFAYIIIARILRGETRTLRQVIEHCAPDHLSHRLVWIGFSQRKAVLFIYVIALGLGVTGILLCHTRNEFDSVLGLVQGFAIVFIVMTLMATAARRQIRHVQEEMAWLNAMEEDGRPQDGEGTCVMGEHPES